MTPKTISTRQGDSGMTRLPGQGLLSKADLHLQTIGTLDEASAWLGLARSKLGQDPASEFLLAAQNHLYLINTELADPASQQVSTRQQLTQQHLQWLDTALLQAEQELRLPRKFVLCGEYEPSAYLDL